MAVWLDPALCDPPHEVDDVLFFVRLTECFARFGWAAEQPVLLGYCFEGRIQLVSGSHRWAAARAAGICVPVVLRSYEEVISTWGEPAWLEWLQNPPLAGSPPAL